MQLEDCKSDRKPCHTRLRLTSRIGLDDLCVRFIINLPEEDLSSVARICFQVEEAQWFYEDFIRPLDPSLPSMSLRTFCLRIFQHCPLLASFSVENHTKAFEEFLQYKTRIPVRGAIMLNNEMDATVLVKGWKKGANWSFPRGKINKDEDDLDCAVREVWEETGLDLRSAGLVPTEGKPKYIEVTMREQQMRLYVFRNVPMDTPFQPQTRKEISKISWYKLSELPAFRKKGSQANEEANVGPSANKFYMVAPFLVPLKKWVMSQKKIDAKRAAIAAGSTNLNPHFSLDEAPTEDDTWPHAHAPVPVKAPAIETLEGATYELQRLLKVQPPTQGLQSSTVAEDKASALLSMLQAKDHAVPAQPQQSNYYPHTPLDRVSGEVPHPGNPHHHSNQRPVHMSIQHPPPSFHIQQSHESQQSSIAPSQMYDAQQLPHLYQNAAYVGQGGNMAQLIHPQPLPPQVQRAVFNQSTNQESQLAARAGMTMQNMQLPHVQTSLQQHSYENAPQATQQYRNPVPEGHGAQLDGRSMALLNAFKRTADQQPHLQFSDQPQTVEQRHTPSQIPSFGQPASAQVIPPLSELTGSSLQQTPVNVPKLAETAPPDKHRSALLGMFKTDGAADAPQTAHEVAASTVRLPGPASGTDKQLLDTLRGLSLGDSPSNATPQPSATIPNPSAALSDFLALKPRNEARQPSVSRQRSNEPAASSARQPNVISQLPTNPPVRILQRGQSSEALGFSGHADAPLHQGLQPKQGAASFPTSTSASSGRSGSVSARRPEATHEQKRQLLSLFGSPQQTTVAGQDLPQVKQDVADGPPLQLGPLPPNPGEAMFGHGHGRVSRQNSTTPMSPADQSFVLDYLQSVTNNAGR
jgi:mRNA-decapping enzyme subunit 2